MRLPPCSDNQLQRFSGKTDQPTQGVSSKSAFSSRGDPVGGRNSVENRNDCLAAICEQPVAACDEKDYAKSVKTGECYAASIFHRLRRKLYGEVRCWP